jgi:hypothetical protein
MLRRLRRRPGSKAARCSLSHFQRGTECTTWILVMRSSIQQRRLCRWSCRRMRCTIQLGRACTFPEVRPPLHSCTSLRRKGYRCCCCSVLRGSNTCPFRIGCRMLGMCHLAACCTFLCTGSCRVSHDIFRLSWFLFASHGFLFVNAPAGHLSHVLDPGSSW